jgi:hypothetical protein
VTRLIDFYLTVPDNPATSAIIRRIDELERGLLGSVRGPGLIAELRSEMEEKHAQNTKRIDAIESDIRWAVLLMKFAIGTIITMAFLSGSGVVTLEHLLKVLDGLLK